jgi:transmembrane sensor
VGERFSYQGYRTALMKKQDFQDLVERYIDGQASDAEVRLLEAYYPRLEGRIDPLSNEQEEALRKEMLAIIMERAGISPAKVVPFRTRVLRYAAAAVVLLGLGAGAYWITHKRVVPQTPLAQAQRFKNDVQPGSNKAVLTLAGGQKIVLDSAHNGLIAQQGSANIVNAAGGQLAYDAQAEKPAETTLYNSLVTPRGGTYRLVLPDGSKVWLNAESSIRYPVAFAGTRREVEITGEAYFEVVHDKNKPFSVKTGPETIEDIGTAFDVKAYADEQAVKATLIEGSVRVAANGIAPSILRQAGEQAVMDKEGNLRVSENVDIAEVLAWKNGQFRFNDASIQTILQQAARWYDVEVDYQTDNKLGFVATISREVPISKLLKILELTDRVHFIIDGKKITVLP